MRATATRCSRCAVRKTLSEIAYNSCMLTYSTLQDRPRDFLAATGLTHEEYRRVLPACVAAYTACYPLDKTWHGKGRQRQLGGGAKGRLAQVEDQRLFILVSQKTNPLQPLHGF